MALTPSKMLALGTKLPDFELVDTRSGKKLSSKDISFEKGLVVAFLCNHCPYVKHIADDFAAFAKDFQPKGVAVVAISSNDVENYPDDSPENMKLEAQMRGYEFAYLFDESQEVAKAFDAACTPEFYLFDGQRKLVYRGRYDESRPGSDVAVSGQDLRSASQALVEGQEISSDQLPSVGCNIKWKAS